MKKKKEQPHAYNKKERPLSTLYFSIDFGPVPKKGQVKGLHECMEGRKKDSLYTEQRKCLQERNWERELYI